MDAALALRAVALVDGRRAEAEIAIRWDREREFRIDPPRVIFSTSPDGLDVPNKRVVIRRIDGASFQISKVETDSSSISVEVEEKCTSQGVIAVSLLRLPEEDARCVETIRITTDSHIEPVISIHVILYRLRDRTFPSLEKGASP